MDDKEYIETLENTIIFLCQTYEECAKEFMYNADTCDRFPTIQGTGNIVAIAQIAEFPLNKQPKYGFRDILGKLKAKGGVK